MPRIHLTTLGGLRIEREVEEIRDLPSQPVRCALLLYLALERAATRDELAALLWPERDADRARHALNQTLYELRRQLGDGWSASHGERVEVTPAVTVDALDFITAAEEARDEEVLGSTGALSFRGAIWRPRPASSSGWIAAARSWPGSVSLDPWGIAVLPSRT